MMMTRTCMSKENLALNCTDEQLKEIVENVINDLSDIFSFKELLRVVCNKLQENRFFDMRPNVEYKGGIGLLPIDSDKVQRIVWNMIWDRRLMIDLYNDEYRCAETRSLRLMKIC